MKHVSYLPAVSVVMANVPSFESDSFHSVSPSGELTCTSTPVTKTRPREHRDRDRGRGTGRTDLDEDLSDKGRADGEGADEERVCGQVLAKALFAAHGELELERVCAAQDAEQGHEREERGGRGGGRRRHRLAPKQNKNKRKKTSHHKA